MRARRKSTKCATPGCRSERGHGTFGDFCEPCAQRLAEIRENWAEAKLKKGFTGRDLTEAAPEPSPDLVAA